MYGTMFTNMRHFLDEDGFLADLMPQGERLYRYLLDIIRGAVMEPEGAVVSTGVKCRRRPGRKPCPGVVHAVWEFEDGGNVTWECLECGDNGHISGIPEDMWDEKESPDDSGEPARLVDVQPVFTPQAKRIWELLDLREQVMILNGVHCATCPRAVSMQLQHGRVEKGDLILTGRCLECGGAVARLVEAG